MGSRPKQWISVMSQEGVRGPGSRQHNSSLDDLRHEFASQDQVAGAGVAGGSVVPADRRQERCEWTVISGGERGT